MNLRTTFLTTLLAIVGLFAFATSASAVVGDAPTTIHGDGVYVETNDALHDMAITIFWTSDDAATSNIDTGTEACAEIAMDCHDTYIMDPAGSSGDELTDSTCATDQTDGVILLSFCN